MKINESKVNKPEDKLSKSINELNQQIKQSVSELGNDLKEDKIDFIKYTEKLSSVFEETITKLNEIDYTLDTQPVADEITTLKSDIQGVKKAVESVKLDPKTEVKVDPPDLSKIEQSLKSVPLSIQALLEGVDIMEREELSRNLKDIIAQLEIIAKKDFGGAFTRGEGNASELYLDIPAIQPVTLCVRTVSGSGATVSSLLRWREEW